MTRILTYLNGRRVEPPFPVILSYHDGKVVDWGEEPLPTEVPAQADFILTALPAAIRVHIIRAVSGGRAQGHRVRIRRRNAADTAWESALAWIDIGRSRSHIFTHYSVTQLIEVGRKYEVKVIAYNIIGDGPESAYKEVVPLTNIPAIPPFKLEAHDAAIRLTLIKVDDPLGLRLPTYEYFIEERNAADTAWVPDADGAQVITSNPFGAAGTHTIISDTETSLVIDVNTMRLSGQSSHNLINDREYRIRVRSDNDVGYSAWSAYMRDTPMAGATPAQLPGLPTFNFAPLRYEYDVTEDSVSTIVNFVPKPNVDGIGVTHWLFRYRRVGATDWINQVIVAQPELDTTYGFKLNQSELGQSYEVQVASRNDAGDSAYTVSQTIVIVIPLADVPTFAIVYHPFVWDNALDFQVEPVASARPLIPITGYDWRFRQVGRLTWTTASSNIAPFYASSVPSSLIGRIIEIQMRAVNGASLSDWSVSQTLQIIDVPNAPTLDLTAQSAGFDVMSSQSQSGYMATGGVVRYREGTSGDWITATSSSIRSLKETTLYQVEAWLTNPAGRSISSFATVTTLAIPLNLPLLPTFTVSVVSQFNPFDYDVAPIQNAAETTTITHWNIRYREQGTTDWTNERVTNASGATYGNTLDRLTVRGKTYEFQVAAENSDGVGPYAASQTITFLGVPDRPEIFLTAQAGGFDLRAVEPPSGYDATGGSFRYREGTSGDWTEGMGREVRGLKGETVYQVEGWTTNLAGRSLSAFATVTTLAAPVQGVGYLAVYGDYLAVYGDDLAVYGE